MKTTDSITIKESLKIKNVGPLKDVFLPEVKPFTVLIGASGSGKSTLMKVIALMRYIYKRVIMKNYLRNSQIDGAIFDIGFRDLLKDGMKELITKQSFIEYVVEVNGHSYTITFKDGRLNTINDIPNNDLVFFKESWVSEMRSVIPVWASRGSLVKGSSFGFYFDETFSDFDQATDEIKKVDLDYLGLKMEVVKGGNNQKKFIIKPIDNSYAPIELKFASSGTQTTAPLITLLRYFSSAFSFKEAMRRSIIMMLFEKNLTEKYHPSIEFIELDNFPIVAHVHIEQPELNLDPRSQRLMVNTMVKYIFHELVDNRKMGLVLATHSPYILNQLNVLLRAGYSKAGKDQYPYLDSDSVSAYKLVNGSAIDLMAIDEDTNQLVINTLDLSEIMEDIYNDYEALA